MLLRPGTKASAASDYETWNVGFQTHQTGGDRRTSAVYNLISVSNRMIMLQAIDAKSI
jgi:hypothetical protein